MKYRVCDDIGLLGRSGEVQGIEEVELLRSCFAGGVEGVITDMCTAIIIGSDCNHRDFPTELISTIKGVRTELIANETTLFATRLQSSGSNHIICE